MEKHISRPHRRALVDLAANDNAIDEVVAFVRALPAAEQRQVRSLLTPLRAGRYLSPAAAARVLELPFEPDDLERIERVVAPWMRRQRRRAVRDEKVRQLGELLLEEPQPPPSGRKLGQHIVALCRRPPPSSDPRRVLVDEILEHSWCNRPPGLSTVRTALAGLPESPRSGQKTAKALGQNGRQS